MLIENHTPVGPIRQSKLIRGAPKFRVWKDPRSKNGIYLCKFYLAGTNHTISTMEAEKRAAERVAAELVLEKWKEWREAGTPHLRTAPSPAPSMETSAGSTTPTLVPRRKNPPNPTTTIAFAADAWLEEYGKVRPRSLKTVKHFYQSWKKRLPVTLVKDLTQERLQDLQAQLITDVSERTADSILTYLKKFCKWCVEKGLLPVDPSDKIDPKKEADYGGKSRNKDIWDESFFEEFLHHFKVPDRKTLRAYWHSGIDLCDLARLETKHIKKYADGVDYIELLRFKAKKKSAQSKEITRLPLIQGSPLRRLVLEAFHLAKKEGRTYLFNRQGVDPAAFTRRLTNKRTEVFKIYYPGKPVLTWKALRYTFFTRCRNQGIPDPVLVKWGGWVDASMLYKHYDQGVTTAEHMLALIRPATLAFKTPVRKDVA
jgi:hypothetical protein